MSELGSIDPNDRALLLSTEPANWLGKIIELNQQPRYRNSLDAIALMCNLNELNAVGEQAGSSRD